jgi:hypothetical protein
MFRQVPANVIDFASRKGRETAGSKDSVSVFEGSVEVSVDAVTQEVYEASSALRSLTPTCCPESLFLSAAIVRSGEVLIQFTNGEVEEGIKQLTRLFQDRRLERLSKTDTAPFDLSNRESRFIELAQDGLQACFDNALRYANDKNPISLQASFKCLGLAARVLESASKAA